MEGSLSIAAQMLLQELRDAIAKFGQEVRSLYRAFGANFPKELSGAAYHYTSEAGLYGILKSGTLWLTDTFSLNDPSELRHGIGLAIKAFDSIGIKDLPERDWYQDALSKVLPHPILRKTVEPYSCSFSKKGDDLGQWRSYADDGRGYSIAFDIGLLDKTFCQEDAKRGAFAVTYDDQGLIDIFEREATLIKPAIYFQPLLLDKMDKYAESIALEFLKWAIMFSLHFKHPAYSNEAEYRFLELLAPSSNPVHKLRPRAQELIKYRELDWKAAGSGVLQKIIIGPAANFEKSKRFAEDCLRESGIDVASIEIIQSEIPYKPA